MREIKFRAWDERNNEMVYSDVSDCFYINTKGALFMYAIPKSESGLETLYRKSYDVEQFTGLKDKDGVDIYEGDIVSILFTDWASQPKNEKRSLDEYLESLEKVFPVCFYKGAFQISGKGYYGNDIGYDDIECGKHGYIKVIGNIHENSELLPC